MFCIRKNYPQFMHLQYMLCLFIRPQNSLWLFAVFILEGKWFQAIDALKSRKFVARVVRALGITKVWPLLRLYLWGSLKLKESHIISGFVWFKVLKTSQTKICRFLLWMLREFDSSREMSSSKESVKLLYLACSAL